MTKDETIDRLWEQSNHGTRREDVVAAYEAGASAEREACALAVDSLMRCISPGHNEFVDAGNREIQNAVRIIRMRSNELPPAAAPAIVGRTPTPWMFENRYNVRKEDFYDESLSEDDLRRIVEKRSNVEVTGLARLYAGGSG